MPDTQPSAGKATPAIERRLRKRHRLSALAYLDIGADNGGIVLDLCEEGIGFQAVALLDLQEDLRLSIKAPDSQTKIEAKARIVWLSKTSRQAGARLLDLTLDGQLRIQNWIRSLAYPLAPLEESEAQREVENIPPGKPGLIAGVRGGKWLSLMPEFDSPFAPEEATEAGDVDLRKGIPTFKGAPGGSQKSGFGSGKVAEIQKELLTKLLASGAGPGVRETNGGGAIASSNPESDTSANVLAERRASGVDSIPADFTPSIRAEEVVFPEARYPLPESSEPLLPAVVPDVSSAPSLLTAPPDAAPTTYGSNIRIRVVRPIILALCAAVLFGTGAWVGRLITGLHNFGTPLPVSRTTTGKIVQQQTIDSAASGTNRQGSAGVGQAPLDKGHSKHPPKRTVFENRVTSSSPPPVAVPSANESAPHSAVEPNLATPQPTPQAVGMPIASPAPPDPPVPAAGPRIVAGRELKPSDRFNPPHLTYRVEPEYPPQALQQGIEGIVKIQLEIGLDGNVRTLKLLSGQPLLAPAAMDAARYWRYLPALLNGQPVDAEQEISIEFRLPRGAAH